MKSASLKPYWIHEDLLTCESTQACAIEKIRQGQYSQPFAISSQQQTKGVGRRGDPWVDSGASVALSLGWHVQEGQDATPDERWPSWVSFWVWQALQSFAIELGSRVYLKWPNDLVYQDKKLGGVIVSQLVYRGETYRVAGVGLNLAWVEPPPVGLRVTDLASITHRPIDRLAVISGILESIATGLQDKGDRQQLNQAVAKLRVVPIS